MKLEYPFALRRASLLNRQCFQIHQTSMKSLLLLQTDIVHLNIDEVLFEQFRLQSIHGGNGLLKAFLPFPELLHQSFLSLSSSLFFLIKVTPLTYIQNPFLSIKIIINSVKIFRRIL